MIATNKPNKDFRQISSGCLDLTQGQTPVLVHLSLKCASVLLWLLCRSAHKYDSKDFSGSQRESFHSVYKIAEWRFFWGAHSMTGYLDNDVRQWWWASSIIIVIIIPNRLPCNGRELVRRNHSVIWASLLNTPWFLLLYHEIQKYNNQSICFQCTSYLISPLVFSQLYISPAALKPSCICVDLVWEGGRGKGRGGTNSGPQYRNVFTLEWSFP